MGRKSEPAPIDVRVNARAKSECRRQKGLVTEHTAIFTLTRIHTDIISQHVIVLDRLSFGPK